MQEPAPPDVFAIQSEPTALWPPTDAQLTEHIAFLRALEARGVTVLSGPLLTEDGSWSGRGVTAIRAESFEAAKRIMSEEPLSLAGLRQQTIERWKLTSGVLTLRVALSDSGAQLA